MRIEKSYSFAVENLTSKKRVDVFLASAVEGLSRSALTGNLCSITINGKPAKKSDTVVNGDVVELEYVAEVFERVEPQDIPLDVLYEDQYMLVINKAQGMVVHPGAGNIDNTVVNALAFRYGQDFIDSMSDECDVSRPGIVHRLDKDTSGVLVIAKTAEAHANLSSQFQGRKIVKMYYAICDGVFPKHTDTVECLLGRDKNDRKLFAVVQSGGKTSKSTYTVERQYVKAALVKVRIFTGRTHQIRVHMKSTGHPVVGDELYNSHNSRFPGFGLMLHSFSIDIVHPATGTPMHFEAPLPERFIRLQELLEKT